MAASLLGLKSVQGNLLLLSRSVVSDCLWPHVLQHTRPPRPSPSPGACSNSCPLSQWCHSTISSSVTLFSSCSQSSPPSGSFQMSQFFLSSDQIIGASASASVLPMNSQGWFPLGRIGVDLLAVQGTLKSLLQHHSSKVSLLQLSDSFMVQLSHPYMTTGKTTALTRPTFFGKVMCLLFNTLSRFAIIFPPRSKHLLISWLQSLSAVILGPKKIVCHCFHCSTSICHEVMGTALLPTTLPTVRKGRVVIEEQKSVFSHVLS